MIAMQYSFTLPADYDMAIVRRRIAEKGHSLDHFDGLRLKAYLHATRGDQSAENLYAPFYVWSDSEAMQRFLGGAGFQALTQAFGWPSIRCWQVWDAYLPPHARQARFASRETRAIAPYTPLDELRSGARDALQRDVERGAVAAVTAFEPTSWTWVSFRLFDETPPFAADARQWYGVGHVSQP
ncbi:DUF4865 family protein [Dyella jiangningensis]|jgi:hypothetical protein|uniref:DUF4865 family protein n=1 Tax=Dyella jiangningensis TaxID=1379159 RepID=UPI0024107135|nr:DUF4865 family protein [Dyella jiangningensis]MDG2538332.1 DUF4865 family protein [Dyella jiangningensis]